jgi:hypothetical protein
MVSLQKRCLQRPRLKRRNFASSAVFCFFLIPLFMVGCTAGHYGHLRMDSHVTRMFDTGSVPGSFRYYTIGRNDLPYAIVGITPGYHLIPDFWNPVEPNNPAFASKVRFIWIPDETWDRYENGEGAWILDARGDKIGIWYSAYPHTVIKVLSDHRVVIFSPYTPINGFDIAQ